MKGYKRNGELAITANYFWKHAISVVMILIYSVMWLGILSQRVWGQYLSSDARLCEGNTLMKYFEEMHSMEVRKGNG